jgi:hypothetical protein
MRGRLSYANVVATFALVFAMSGGALAANHYLINSTKQISPKVLKKLKGAAGKAGQPGTAGAAGAAGKEGLQGKEGQSGKEGKQGAEGARGPSDLFTATAEGSFDVTSTAKTLSLVLPAGSYAITAKTQEQNLDAAHFAALRCSIESSAKKTILDEMFTDSPPSSGEYGIGDAANALQATLTTPGETISYGCRGSNGATSMHVNNMVLSAIAVGAIH